MYFTIWDAFFKIPKNLIFASAKTSNAALVNLLIESLKIIMWLTVRCFSVNCFNKNTLYKNTEAQITQKWRTI